MPIPSLLAVARRTAAALAVGTCLVVSAVFLAPAAEAAPVTGRTCTASVTVPKPKVGARETVVVGTTKNAKVSINVRYKSTSHPFAFTADRNGAARYTFATGKPTPRYTVVIDVTTSSHQTCSTRFTPQ